MGVAGTGVSHSREDQPMAEARIIKRYANRKLYDTQHSRYVTLEQISEMIRNGDEVKIVDNKTKEDLTSVTLAQIIFEEEKKQRSFLPLGAMRNIIQNGGEWFAEAQRRVSSILPGKRGHGEQETDEIPPHEGENGETSLEDTATYAGTPRGKQGVIALREWVESSKQTLEEWQKRIDGRVRTAIEGISPFAGLHKDVKHLADRIAELEAKLTKIDDEET
ncbi:MAG TPA: polyhydroxyalkanoate synthesis regulator DNA-binding domain-containing protein [Kofleriaceae bacterium]|nr:polyhydroxyalkanoate synthesis regulator DNA-binding domain-containing protein [Kofleriaceae bacterium]